MGAGGSSRPYYDSSLSNEIMSKMKQNEQDRVEESTISPFLLQQKIEMKSSFGSFHVPEPMDPTVLRVPYFNNYPFHDYRFLKKVGSGRFSVVYKAAKNLPATASEQASPQPNMNLDRFAVKEIAAQEMSSLEYEDLRYEMCLVSHLNHENIVKFIAIYEPPAINAKLYGVYEYLRGGELLISLCQQDNYSLFDVLFLFQQIASGLHYLHSHGIVHGNLVPENLILQSRYNSLYRSANVVKIVGFDYAEGAGLASNKRPLQKFTKESVFSPPERRANDPFSSSMAAPSQLEKESFEYRVAADIWTFASFFFFLLEGKFPSYQTRGAFRQVTVGELKFPSRLWDSIGEPGKEFFRSCLHVLPRERATSREILRQEWFKRPIAFTEEGNHSLTENLPQLRLFQKDRAKPAFVTVAEKVENAAVGGQPTRLSEEQQQQTAVSLFNQLLSLNA